MKIIKNNIKSVIKDEESDKIKTLLPDSFVGLLVGKPGSGKSYLIRELMKNP